MAGNLRIFSQYFLVHLKTMMEYRVNFLIQSVFMVLNNALWLLIWYFLFAAFETVNGYGFADAMLIFAIAAISFGFSQVLFGNAGRLWEEILEGRFDFYLSLPVEPIFHSIIGRSSFSAVGDLAFGVVLVLLLQPAALPIALLAGFISSILLTGFFILFDSIAFFLPRPKRLRLSLTNALVSFAVWPIDAFGPVARGILYAIAVAFISVVPYHATQSFSWGLIGLLSAVSLTVLLLGCLVFKYGLLRYESGNLVATRS